MLQHLLLPLAFAIAVFTGCKRDDDLSPPPPPTPAATFGISSDTAVQVMRARSATASLLVSDSGAGQVVRLSISGLPTGITAQIDPSIGSPSYSSTVRFSASVYAAAGSSSTATVLAKMADGTEKRHSLRVIVLENPNCIEVVSGEYSGYGGSGGGYLSTITADSALPTTRVRIKGFFAPMFDGYADLNCSDGTVEFPLQSFTSGNVISGSGTFTHDTVRAAMTHVYPEPGPNGPTGQLITRYFEMMFARK
jgi:hypothetical protein